MDGIDFEAYVAIFDFFSAVLGALTVLAVQRVAAWLRRPILRLHFSQETPGCALSNPLWNEDLQSYGSPVDQIRLRVTNVGRSPAKEVKGFVISLQIDGSSDVHDHFALCWGRTGRSANIDIPPGISFWIDIMSFKGDDSGGRQFSTPAHSQAPFQARQALRVGRDVSLTILVQADNCASRKIKVSLSVDADGRLIR